MSKEYQDDFCNEDEKSFVHRILTREEVEEENRKRDEELEGWGGI